MERVRTVADSISQFLHRYFLALLLAAYALAAVMPGLGQRMRHMTFGEIAVSGDQVALSLPFAMLAFLLCNAGLATETSELRNIARRPWPLVFGLLANLAVPLVLIFGIAQGLRWWPEVDETQTVLVGLALVAAMPIAGSSTAWTQKAIIRKICISWPLRGPGHS